MSYIDTADHVHHSPSGEDWVVAYVQGEHLAWCGWPEGLAKVADCRLIRKASAVERDKLLRELAASGGNDTRVRHARHVLGLGATEGGAT